MILRPSQIMQLRLGRPVNPANFGGDSKSDSSTSTINDTKNWVSNIDKRAVAQDLAVSLDGSNNTIYNDKSTTFTDMSDRSSTSLTSFIDNSNRSTNFTDNSDNSVRTTITDYGSVGSALSGMGAMTNRAFDSVDIGMGGGIDILKLQTVEGHKSLAAAFAMANKSSESSAKTSADVLGFARQTMQSNNEDVLGFARQTVQATQTAFANAEDGGQGKMMLAALVVVGAVGIAFAMKN